MELSRQEVDQLVIAELLSRFPGALPISINYESRTEGGFCHCYYVPKLYAEALAKAEGEK
jgi:hypothetical protein